jgi:hypothetical protein
MRPVFANFTLNVVLDFWLCIPITNKPTLTRDRECRGFGIDHGDFKFLSI